MSEDVNDQDDLAVVRLSTIPAADSRPVITGGKGDTVVFRGQVSTPPICCGNCSSPLAIGILVGQLSGLILQCTRCGSYNDPSRFV